MTREFPVAPILKVAELELGWSHPAPEWATVLRTTAHNIAVVRWQLGIPSDRERARIREAELDVPDLIGVCLARAPFSAIDERIDLARSIGALLVRLAQRHAEAFDRAPSHEPQHNGHDVRPTGPGDPPEHANGLDPEP